MSRNQIRLTSAGLSTLLAFCLISCVKAHSPNQFISHIDYRQGEKLLLEQDK